MTNSSPQPRVTAAHLLCAFVSQREADSAALVAAIAEREKLVEAFIECYAAIDPTWNARADWRWLYDKVRP